MKQITAIVLGAGQRGVYACDSDAMDHQVANLSFEYGVTASPLKNDKAPG